MRSQILETGVYAGLKKANGKVPGFEPLPGEVQWWIR